MRPYPFRSQDPDRPCVWPLVDIEREDLPLEWVAAMYESYAADHEYFRARWERSGGPDVIAAGHYARAAHRFAEEIETAAYQDPSDW